MPILTYFVVMGTTLLALLNLASYALPDIGPPIKTSQLVGLPKVEPQPDPEPLISTFNFGVPRERVDTQLPDTVYAKDTSTLNVHPTKQRQPSNRGLSASRRRPVYSYDIMMSTH